MGFFGLGREELFLIKTRNSYYVIERDRGEWYLLSEYRHNTQSRTRYPILGTAEDILDRNKRPIIRTPASHIDDVWMYRGRRMALEFQNDAMTTSEVETIYPLIDPDTHAQQDSELLPTAEILTTNDPEGLFAAIVGSDAYLLWVHGRKWYLAPDKYGALGVVAIHRGASVIKKMADHHLMAGASLIYRSRDQLMRTTIINIVVPVTLPVG